MNIVTAMQKHSIYPVINEDDDQHIVTSTGIDNNKRKSNNMKSDEEVLQMYKRMIGDETEDAPLPRLWQEQINNEKIKEEGQTTSPVSLPKPTTKNQPVAPNKVARQKSFELSSLNPNIPEKDQKRFVSNKNATNYSEGYKETKPFSLKKDAKNNTTYLQQTPLIPPSPEGSAKQSTTDNFVKKLHNNIIKDKGQQGSRIGKVVQQIKAGDKKLRDNINILNNQEILLQEKIRQYHLQYKSYCRNIEDKHEINYNKSEIQSNKEILTLQSQSKNSKKLSKKAQLVQEYKLYTDKIQVEIRKFDYLINIKKSSIEEQESNIESSKLYKLLQEPIQDHQKESQQIRPIVQGATYKDIMRARKNKDFSKLNRLIVEKKQEQAPAEKAFVNQIEIQQKKEQVCLYETQEGQVKVNQNLRNLLLQ